MYSILLAPLFPPPKNCLNMFPETMAEFLITLTTVLAVHHFVKTPA